jgi:hypothetical protein
MSEKKIVEDRNNGLTMARLSGKLLVAAMIVGAGVSTASAASFPFTGTFTGYNSTDVLQGTGPLTGNLDLTAGTGSIGGSYSGSSSGISFTVNATATAVKVFNTPGSYTWSFNYTESAANGGATTNGTYSFTLGANQVAVEFMATSQLVAFGAVQATYTNVPILVGWNLAFPDATHTTLTAFDIDQDGHPGSTVLVGSLAGNRAVYEGTLAGHVPVPAAAWLFGSGLLGLVGVARRRRTVA